MGAQAAGSAGMAAVRTLAVPKPAKAESPLRLPVLVRSTPVVDASVPELVQAAVTEAEGQPDVAQRRERTCAGAGATPSLPPSAMMTED
ncbi:MAG TPA: hypothetical protein VEK37_05100 [Gemmatimonadaceae bacterium]|nr:hypothetical protein [Gemmatimonadaceae bacterium]